MTETTYTTVAVTLGHDGLTVDSQHARMVLTDVLTAQHAGNVLGTFYDGIGCWIDADDVEHVETSDCWLISLPTDRLALVAASLSTLAALWGQDALGFVVHDDRRGESYVVAE